jgi:tetratricopeptide (TPR) repeat protein
VARGRGSRADHRPPDELIRPDRAEFAGEDAFRFRHLLIRDAAYQAMPKEQRADLHERFAGWLEHAAGERAAEYEEILAHHLEQAYRYRTELGTLDDRTRELGNAAASRLMRSADRALDRGDFRVARQMLTRGAEISGEGTRALAFLQLADVMAVEHDYQASAAAAREAIETAEGAGEHRYAIRARVIETVARGQTDPSHTLAQTRADIDAALQELRALGDEDGVVLALLFAGWHAFFAGRCDESLAMGEQLLARAQDLPSRLRRDIGVLLNVSAYFGPTPVHDAFRYTEIARSLRADTALSEVTFGFGRVGLLAMDGSREEAEAQIERSTRLLDEIGSEEFAVTRAQSVGEAYRLLGQPDRAEEHFRRGVAIFDRLGETGFNSTMTALLALSLCDQGRFDEAEPFVARSRGLGAEDDFATQVAWRMGDALVRSHRADHDGAIALADQAVAIIEDTDYLAWQGDVHEVRGIVLDNAGRREEAERAFEEAKSRYERKGVVPAVARILERLSALGASS